MMKEMNIIFVFLNVFVWVFVSMYTLQHYIHNTSTTGMSPTMSFVVFNFVLFFMNCCTLFYVAKKEA